MIKNADFFPNGTYVDEGTGDADAASPGWVFIRADSKEIFDIYLEVAVVFVLLNTFAQAFPQRSRHVKTCVALEEFWLRQHLLPMADRSQDIFESLHSTVAEIDSRTCRASAMTLWADIIPTKKASFLNL